MSAPKPWGKRHDAEGRYLVRYPVHKDDPKGQVTSKTVGNGTSVPTEAAQNMASQRGWSEIYDRHEGEVVKRFTA